MQELTNLRDLRQAVKKILMVVSGEFVKLLVAIISEGSNEVITTCALNCTEKLFSFGLTLRYVAKAATVMMTGQKILI